jgi:murein L,D-transpeptidase YcbB/YkuD
MTLARIQARRSRIAGFVVCLSCHLAWAQAPEVRQLPARQVAGGWVEGALSERTEAAGRSRARTPLQRAELQRLYRAGGHAPLWVDPDGRPGHGAKQALAILAGAAHEGLNPSDYGTASLAARADRLAAAAAAEPQSTVDWDVDLSLAVLRYLRELHFGRVDPRTLGFRVSPVRTTEHDFAELLRTALAEQQLLRLAADMAPPMEQYRQLRMQLAHYRGLASAANLAPLPTTGTVRPGDDYAGARALHDRLVAFGDLPADVSDVPAPGRYDAALVDGVKRFQARHGLLVDGLLGKASQAALNVSPAHRVRQIELAMERLRWLPHRSERAALAINIPDFRLWAWAPGAPEASPALSTEVIVGEALKTHTPVFSDEMRYLIFRPYWNVPRSIVRKEVLPALARDPSYLRRHEMEIVQGPGDDARPVPATAHHISLLAQGALRLRQRPGPRNALGLVKFIFPNDDSVYLHDTPTQRLFSRNRRDFSHGCVRVADAVALAEWLLRDQPQWTRERIVAAMNGTQTLRVDLLQPVKVLLYYVTAFVMPQDGRPHFVDDIYGHDARLERALALARPR